MRLGGAGLPGARQSSGDDDAFQRCFRRRHASRPGVGADKRAFGHRAKVIDVVGREEEGGRARPGQLARSASGSPSEHPRSIGPQRGIVARSGSEAGAGTHDEETVCPHCPRIGAQNAGGHSDDRIKFSGEAGGGQGRGEGREVEPLIHDAVSQQDRGLVDVRSRQNEYIDIQPGITGGRQFKDGHSLRW